MSAQHEHTHNMRIHIDQNPYDSPNPTTGAALYLLGKVDAGLELFREVNGDWEDPEVPNGPEVVHLKENERYGWQHPDQGCAASSAPAPAPFLR
jgi:hypothetical protein